MKKKKITVEVVWDEKDLSNIAEYYELSFEELTDEKLKQVFKADWESEGHIGELLSVSLTDIT